MLRKRILWSCDLLVKTINSSHYSWACSPVAFVWRRGIWVIVLKRKCLCIKYSNVLAILSYFWLILLMMRHCTAYGCSNRSNKVEWENLSWHKHRSKHMLLLYMYGEGRHHWTFEHGLHKNMCLEVCFPVLFAWGPKCLTFMRFYMETAELQAQL